jgi:hypothetical protein
LRSSRLLCLLQTGKSMSRDFLASKSTAAQKVRLLKILSSLAPLSNLPWVCGPMEDAKISLHNGRRLASDTLGRLATWAARWNALDGRLRALYGDSLATGAGAYGSGSRGGPCAVTRSRYTAVSIAVWKILNGGHPPDNHTYKVLSGLWVERFGYRPPIEIIPMKEGR